VFVHAFSLQVETALLDSLAENEVHEEQESRSQTELRTSQRSQFPVERRQGIQKGMLFPRFFGQEFRRISRDICSEPLLECSNSLSKELCVNQHRGQRILHPSVGKISAWRVALGSSPAFASTVCSIIFIKCYIMVGHVRRKFRSQTSDNIERWKSRGGKSQRREERKREDQRRERVRRKKMQVHEKVTKSRNTVFFQRFVAPEGRTVGTLKRRVRSQLAR